MERRAEEMDDMEESNQSNSPNAFHALSPTESSRTNHKRNNRVKEQDGFLPIANVGRIMKNVIPGNGKISKEAKEIVQECVSEFISFVTGEASDKCQMEKRKTINGDDILWAITTLGFEDYVAPLQMYLNKYRKVEGDKVNMPKQQGAEKKIQQAYPQHEHQQPKVSSPFNTGCSSQLTNTIMRRSSFPATSDGFCLGFTHSGTVNQFCHADPIDSAGGWPREEI